MAVCLPLPLHMLVIHLQSLPPVKRTMEKRANDLAALGGALVVNMGTVTPEGLENYLKAIQAYNAANRPVVYDPWRVCKCVIGYSSVFRS